MLTDGFDFQTFAILFSGVELSIRISLLESTGGVHWEWYSDGTIIIVGSIEKECIEFSTESI